MDDREKIIDRIKKIQAKAEGTDNLKEAEAFLDKMHSLMQENGIKQEDLKETMEHHIGKMPFDLTYPDAWRKALVMACGDLCGCAVVFDLEKGNRCLVFGRKDNCIATGETYNWIHSQIRLIARSLFPDRGKEYRQAQEGIAAAISIKIENIIKSNSTPTGATDKMVPVVVEGESVKAMVYAMDGMETTELKPATITLPFLHGALNAERVQIRKPVDS